VSDPYVRDFLRDFDQRAPQGAALLAFLAVAATAPAQVRSSDVQGLHTRHPRTRRVTADVVRGMIDPDGAHDPVRGSGLGSVQPTGAPATRLIYDRRLGVLSWVDDTGWPTYAPLDYRDAAVVIVGAPPHPGTVIGIYFAFAERQRLSATVRTLERVQDTLTPEAISAVQAQPSPFDQCRLDDIAFAHQERMAIERASGAVVARAIHELRVIAEGDREHTRVGEQQVANPPASDTIGPPQYDNVAPMTSAGDSGHRIVPGSIAADSNDAGRGVPDIDDAVESTGQQDTTIQ